MYAILLVVFNLNAVFPVSNRNGIYSGQAAAMETDARPPELLAAVSSTLKLQARDSSQFVSAVKKVVERACEQVGATYISPPLLKEPLGAEQMDKLGSICEALAQEYSVRRQV